MYGYWYCEWSIMNWKRSVINLSWSNRSTSRHFPGRSLKTTEKLGIVCAQTAIRTEYFSNEGVECQRYETLFDWNHYITGQISWSKEQELHWDNIMCGGHRIHKYRSTDKIKKFLVSQKLHVDYHYLFHSCELYPPKQSQLFPTLHILPPPPLH